MTETKRAWSPFSPADDRDAALYLGHLAVAAESALPDAARESQVALAWLVAQVASRGDRFWRARLDGIEVAGNALGDWVVTVRLFPGKPVPIGIERRTTLIEDGRQVIALAHPFLTNNSREAAVSDMLDFCVMQLAAEHFPTACRIRLQDSLGTGIRVTIRPTGLLSALGLAGTRGRSATTTLHEGPGSPGA